MEFVENGGRAATARAHPCFSEEAHDRVGRVHLPVAVGCNIQCGFCERRVCANLTMQHPGWARETLTPQQALGRVRTLVSEHVGEPFAVGIAGPGEPLASGATFETLAMVQGEFPELMTCLSSNGLLLADELEQIVARGVRAVTVTVNATDADAGARIYRWVRYQGETYRGREGAALLLERQLAGIEAAAAAGLAVKVNTVLIPDVNLDGVADIARQVAVRGAQIMNLMALIPGGAMRDGRAPTCEELQQARASCEAVLPQFRRCEHCRADVVRFPGG